LSAPTRRRALGDGHERLPLHAAEVAGDVLHGVKAENLRNPTEGPFRHHRQPRDPELQIQDTQEQVALIFAGDKTGCLNTEKTRGPALSEAARRFLS